jgi:hypothetical protein
MLKFDKALKLSAATLMLALPLVAQSGDRQSAAPASTQLTAEQDHQRILDELHITSFRRGADGRPNSPYAANTDESKAALHSRLPDPLVFSNGKPVRTAKDWWKKRRPEIVESFEREVYGRVPKNAPAVHWTVTSTTQESVAGIPAITKKLVGHADNSAFPSVSVDIQLSLTTPAQAQGPVPVMMELSFSPEIMARIAAAQARAGALGNTGPSWQEQLLRRNWGYATLLPTSVQPDNGAGLAQGIIGLTSRGRPRALDDWGALRAWAWGASRALDYFETDHAVDAKRVGIEGLSRYGKAALVTMAFDPRFAIGFIASSGAGGAKLWRRDFGEKLENLAGSGEYHWMAGNFLKYAGPRTPDDLPVDAHELIALCAPRPVFISVGSQGENWADPKGMFLAAVAAGPVYRLLGKKDLGTTEFPPVETALVDGDISFRQHNAGHTAGPNWPTFLTLAARYLGDN